MQRPVKSGFTGGITFATGENPLFCALPMAGSIRLFRVRASLFVVFFLVSAQDAKRRAATGAPKNAGLRQPSLFLPWRGLQTTGQVARRDSPSLQGREGGCVFVRCGWVCAPPAGFACGEFPCSRTAPRLTGARNMMLTGCCINSTPRQIVVVDVQQKAHFRDEFFAKPNGVWCNRPNFPKGGWPGSLEEP